MTEECALDSPNANEIEARVAAAIGGASELRSLPVVVLELESLLADHRTNAQDVADLLSRDPAICTRILKTANSAYYGSSREVSTLPRAIVLIGFQTVQNIALTVGVVEALRPSNSTAFDFGRFWQHSVATAIAAERIAVRSGLRADGAYMSGLLHDVGSLIIAQDFEDLTPRLDQLREQGASKINAELAILGIDHAQLGSRFLEAWALPPPIVEAVQMHHVRRWDADTPVGLAEVVQLANIIASALGHGSSDHGESLSHVTAGLADRLGYDEVTLAEWIDEIDRDLEQASDFFALVG